MATKVYIENEKFLPIPGTVSFYGINGNLVTQVSIPISGLQLNEQTLSNSTDLVFSSPGYSDFVSSSTLIGDGDIMVQLNKKPDSLVIPIVIGAAAIIVLSALFGKQHS